MSQQYIFFAELMSKNIESQGNKIPSNGYHRPGYYYQQAALFAIKRREVDSECSLLRNYEAKPFDIYILFYI